jgi:transposase
MLRMDQVHVIRHKVLVEGLSQRNVARQLGVSRNTVRKYVGEAEPAFRKPASRRRPVTDPLRPRLDDLLEQWSDRSTRKQRITGTRLHRQLVQEGYEVGETTVRALFREWQRRFTARTSLMSLVLCSSRTMLRAPGENGWAVPLDSCQSKRL